jgi:hypothetical protein
MMNDLDRLIAAERKKWREAQRPTFTGAKWCSGLGIYVTAFPFRRVTWNGRCSWRPGTAPRPLGGKPQIAHGMGEQIIEVVGFHKEWVFYLRSWRDPDGREFARANNAPLVDTFEVVTAMIRGVPPDAYLLSKEKAPPRHDSRRGS